jgi:hypothetical protein
MEIHVTLTSPGSCYPNRIQQAVASYDLLQDALNHAHSGESSAA